MRHHRQLSEITEGGVLRRFTGRLLRQGCSANQHCPKRPGGRLFDVTAAFLTGVDDLWSNSKTTSVFSMAVTLNKRVLTVCKGEKLQTAP